MLTVQVFSRPAGILLLNNHNSLRALRSQRSLRPPAASWGTGVAWWVAGMACWVLAVKSFLRVAGLRSRDANDETKPPNGVFDPRQGRFGVSWCTEQTQPEDHRQTVGRRVGRMPAISRQPSAFSGRSPASRAGRYRLTFASPGGRVKCRPCLDLMRIQTVSRPIWATTAGPSGRPRIAFWWCCPTGSATWFWPRRRCGPFAASTPRPVLPSWSKARWPTC